MVFDLTDAVGLLGVAFILFAYGGLQMDRLDATALSYSLINGLGALFILISLIKDFNLSAFMIEGCWLVISLWGMAKAVRARAKPSNPPAPQLHDR